MDGVGWQAVRGAQNLLLPSGDPRGTHLTPARSLALSLSLSLSLSLPLARARFRALSLYEDRERESSFIDNLLVRIHFIIVMISVDRPCAMGV